MAQIFNLTFPANLSEFTSTVTDGGDLFWDSGTLGGVAGRVGFLIDDMVAIYGTKTFSAVGSITDFRWRIYTASLASLTMAGGDTFDLLWIGEPASTRCYVTYNNNFGTRRLGIQARKDDDSFTSTLFANLGSTVYVEFHYHRATNNSSADGYYDVYFDGVKQGAGLTGIDNYDTMALLDRLVIGPRSGIDAGTSGTAYFGQIVAQTDGSLIGPLGSAPVLTIPADLDGLYTVTKNTTGVSFTGTGVDEADITGPANLAISVIASGSAIVTGNGTNEVNITGTNAEVLATLASIDFDREMPGGSTWELADTVTVTVYNSFGQDSDSFDINWVPDSGINKSAGEFIGTSAQIKACLAAGLGITPYPDFTGIFNIEMYSEVDTSPVLTDADQFFGTVTDVVNTAPRIVPPGPLTALIDVPKFILPGFSIIDDEDNVSYIIITCTLGTIEVTIGGSASIVDGANESDYMKVTGTLADLNAVTYSMFYTGTSEGVASVTVQAVDDEGATVQESTTISVSPAPQPVAEAGFFQLF